MTNPGSDRLLELQKRFLVRLESRMAELTATLNGSADAESLMRMFHSLTGIGGTYGFHRITEISRICEELCTSVIEERRMITSVENRHLQRAVVEIGVSATSPAWAS